MQSEIAWSYSFRCCALCATSRISPGVFGVAPQDFVEVRNRLLLISLSRTKPWARMLRDQLSLGFSRNASLQSAIALSYCPFFDQVYAARRKPKRSWGPAAGLRPNLLEPGRASPGRKALCRESPSCPNKFRILSQRLIAIGNGQLKLVRLQSAACSHAQRRGVLRIQSQGFAAVGHGFDEIIFLIPDAAAGGIAPGGFRIEPQRFAQFDQSSVVIVPLVPDPALSAVQLPTLAGSSLTTSVKSASAPSTFSFSYLAWPRYK